jgi:hypothetical protein
MRALPIVRALLTDAEQQALDTMPPAVGLVSAFGCPFRWCGYATDEEAVATNYRIHPFRTIYLTQPERQQTTTLQYEALQTLVPGGLLARPAPLIVINCAGCIEDGLELMWHLAGSLANLRCRTRDQSIMFAYLADAWLQNEENPWIVKPRHVVAWGPLTDDSREFAYERAVSFLTNFHYLTRILLVAVSDVGTCLRRLHVSPEKVSNLFWVSSSWIDTEVPARKAKVKPEPIEPKARKPRTPKSVSI